MPTGMILESLYTSLTNGRVRVVFRDELNSAYNATRDKIPNQEFPVAQDNEGQNFTVARTDALGNRYAFGGWATNPQEHIRVFDNGDRAYVNTIPEGDDGVAHNTLYAIWGTCKVVDKDDREFVFETIEDAVVWIKGNASILPKVNGTPVGTIEMLIYLKMSGPVYIDYDSPHVVLTTAQTEAADQAAQGGKKKWRFHYEGENEETTGIAEVERAFTQASVPSSMKNRMFTSKGDFTLRNITLDGGSLNGFESTEIGGIIRSTGTLRVQKGTTLQNSKTTKHAGAISSDGGNIYVQGESGPTDIVFDNCESAVTAGALYANGANLTLEWRTFKKCKATGTDGGAVRHLPGGGDGAQPTNPEGASSTIIRNCVFSECTAQNSAGAMQTEAKTLTVEDTLFIKCEAKSK